MDKAMQVALDATVQGWVKSGQARALAAALASHLGQKLVPEGAEVAPEGYVATEYVNEAAKTMLVRAAKGFNGEDLGWAYYRGTTDRGDEPRNEDDERVFPGWLSRMPLLGWPTAQAAADAVAALQGEPKP